ncbi:hypothetical protein SAMN05880501_113119 [Ureibacillus xyleni]|uniref:Protein involved in plasmid replication-relaxation n=1 Tax=Ureibacillus xyleni TaxID=614648 RepID=A0A285TJ49_9BACL|nr:hypothetical protein [Ureibacillus xyleni]SOC22052.1 hypothetical protein SAMN05880501_113119 [Ureibacillus xyleni]
MEKKPFISPFSLRRHEWKVEWRVQSERPVNREMQRFTGKEERVMQDLAVLQIITHKHLKKHYKMHEKQIQNMLAKRLLVQHRLIKNKETWFIYTREAIEGYKKTFVVKNYWLGYGKEEILQRLVLVDFYFELQRKMNTDITLKAVAIPFQAIFIMNDKAYEVYINRGDPHDLLVALNQSITKERRLFIVTEQLIHLNVLATVLERPKILYRVITDEDIYRKDKHEFFHTLPS